MIPSAPYLPTDDPDVVESTELALAGWSDNGQHGGVVAALLGRAIESVPTLAPMEVARLTTELFRLVPIVPLRLVTEVVREGKKIQVVSARAFGPDGTEFARALGLRLRVSELSLPEDANPALHVPTPDDLDPEDMAEWGIGEVEHTLYHRHAVEVREINDGFKLRGPGAMWMRVHAPLVAGETVSPLTRAVVTADFINGLSRLVDTDKVLFMNADLSVHLSRLPRGEWIGVTASSRYQPGGRGIASGELFDIDSVFGRSTQTIFLDPVS